MKHLLLISLILCGYIQITYGQITLEECQKLARLNYPLIHQHELIKKSTDFSVTNAARGWIPQLSLSAQATYQSVVTEFPAQMNALYEQMGLDIKGINKDQYKATLELDQTIYDGGAIRSQKKIAGTEGDMVQQNIEVEMYTIRTRINDLYFGILSLKEQYRQNQLLQELLSTNYQTIKAYMDNGTAMPSDLDAVRVEQLTVKQQLIQIEFMTDAYVKMLSIMTGKQITTDENLEKPGALTIADTTINRPELNLFAAQSAQLEAQKQAIRSANRPHLGAFIQGTYGNPGLNLFKDMMQNQFSWYYIAGIRLQWNFSSFYTKKNNLRKIELSQQQIGNQQETFLFNTNLQITQEQSAIDKMRNVLAQDEEIIALRTSIRKAAETKLANGIISVSDLIREINTENKAILARSAHGIELLKNIYDLKETKN